MTVEEIRKLIEELNLRVPKDYQKMNVNKLGVELQEVIDFEQKTFQKIEEFENQGSEQDLITYAKMIVKNTTEQKISKIQEVYLKKIDSEFLKSN